MPHLDAEQLAQMRALLASKIPPMNSDTAPGLVPNVMTGRIANRLNLRGPNYLVDAACSSSLLAVGAAIDELRAGRSRLMLAGGVNASLPADVTTIFTQLGALSARGKVRPFEAGSDGTPARRRPGRGRIEAPARCARRWRPRLCGAARRRPVERWPWHWPARAEPGWRDARDSPHVCRGRRRSCDDRPDRSAWHRHPARRQDRDRFVEGSVRRPQHADRHQGARLGQVDDQPLHPGGWGGQSHQDGALAASQSAAADAVRQGQPPNSASSRRRSTSTPRRRPGSHRSASRGVRP